MGPSVRALACPRRRQRPSTSPSGAAESWSAPRAAADGRELGQRTLCGWRFSTASMMLSRRSMHSCRKALFDLVIVWMSSFNCSTSMHEAVPRRAMHLWTSSPSCASVSLLPSDETSLKNEPASLMCSPMAASSAPILPLLITSVNSSMLMVPLLFRSELDMISWISWKSAISSARSSSACASRSGVASLIARCTKIARMTLRREICVKAMKKT
mmetsp:Transcript_10986/g.24163  ORF Transcript_10986/g.24163 Transcript_10986/m.24163 type:complete len:214 (-) Transcript_10986:261-902(-)